jgi:hypothetical protein
MTTTTSYSTPTETEDRLAILELIVLSQRTLMVLVMGSRRIRVPVSAKIARFRVSRT